jgi:hypothetical protein
VKRLFDPSPSPFFERSITLRVGEIAIIADQPRV